MALDTQDINLQEQPQPTQQVDNTPTDAKYNLWKGLSKEGLYTKTFNDFKQKYSNKDNIDYLFNTVGPDGEKLYTKSKSDFYNQYFPEATQLKKKNQQQPSANVQQLPQQPQNLGSAGGATNISQSGLPSQSPSPENDADLIGGLVELSKKSKELGNAVKTIDMPSSSTVGGPVVSTTQPDEEKVAQSKKIKDYLKSQGYDTDFTDAVSDLPNLPNSGYGSEGYLADLYKNNKVKFNQTVSSIKWQNPLINAMDNAIEDVNKDNSLTPELKASKIDEINADKTALSAGQSGGVDKTYEQKKTDTDNATNLIHKYIDNSDDQQNALKNLVKDHSLAYGNDAAVKSRTDNPIPGLNPAQSIGFDLYSRQHPEEVPALSNYINLKDEDVSNDYYANVARQSKLKELEETGLNTIYSNNKSHYDDFVKKSKEQNGLSPDDLAKANQYKDKMDNVSEQMKQLSVKYPDISYLDADKLAQEELGQRKTGVDYLTNLAAYNAYKTGQGVYNLLASPFRSQKGEALAQLNALGGEQVNGPNLYVTQANTTLPDFKILKDNELQDKIDEVKNDYTLTDEERKTKVARLFIDNKDKYSQEKTDEGLNVGANTLIYGVGKMAADLFPYIAAEAFTGGGATAGLGKKLFTTFGNVLATSYQDELANATAKNEANPRLKAFTNTGINALAYTVGDIPERIKAAAGTKTAMGIAINKLSDDEILTALRDKPSVLKDFFSKLPEAAKEGALGAAKMQPILGASQLIQQKIDGKDVDYNQFAKQQILQGLNFALFGTGIGAISKNVPDAVKEQLYLAGKNSEEALGILKQKEADGTIKPLEASQIRDNIQRAKDVYEKTPMVDAKGNKLDDKSRNELMFLKMQEDDLESNLNKDLPKDLQDAMSKRLSDIKDKMDDVYKGTFITEAIPSKKEEIKAEPIPTGAGKVQPIEITGTKVFEHGEDNKTAQGLENGVKDDSHLTPEGLQEAEDIGNYIKENNPDLTTVEHSDVERGIQTGKKVAEVAGVKSVSNPIYRTADIGRYDGQPEGSFDEKGWTEGEYNNDNTVEKFDSFTNRMEKAYDHTKNELGKETAVITHSKVTRALRALEETDGKWTDETTKKFLELGKKEEGELPESELKEGAVLPDGRTVENINKGKGLVNVSKVDENGNKVTQLIPISEAENLLKEPIKTTKNAIQEPSAESVLQRQQGETGATGGERGGVESGEQRGEPAGEVGEQPEAEKEGETINDEKTTSTEAPTGVEEGDKNLVGVSHSSLSNLAKKLNLPEPIRGQYYPPKWYADRGRTLLENGANPDDVTDYNAPLHDRISIARAQLEKLKKESDAVAAEFGIDSDEYKYSLNKLAEYAVKTKLLGTEAARSFVALQGERDIDTDDFQAVSNRFKAITRKALTKEQEAKAKSLTKDNQIRKARLTVAEKDAVDAANKEFLGEGVENEPKKKLSEIAKKYADTFRKLKTKPLTFTDENGNQIPIQIQGASWNDLVELGAKAIEKTGQIADGVAIILDKIKESEWYNKLSDKDKNKLEKDLTQHYTDAIKETPEDRKIRLLEKEKDDLERGIVKQKKESNLNPTPEQQQKIDKLNDDIYDLKKNLGILKSKGEKPLTDDEIAKQNEERLNDLQNKFKDKRDNKFNIDESKDIWKYAKDTYLDKGASYRDMIGYVASDLGLSWRQVNEAINTPKTQRISDAMWKREYDYNRGRVATENWIDEQALSGIPKSVRKVTNLFRSISVFGHGGIFVGTHAGMTLFQPSTWKQTIPAFLNGWKFAYGSEANYQKAINELKHSPNYVTAQRAGLKNNPDATSAKDIEEFQTSQKYMPRFLSKAGAAGEKGFNAIKVLRQGLFDSEFNKLSEADKADPEVAKSIARLINNATGATNLNVPKWVNEVTFAGGMEASRWAKLTRNPVQATTYAIKALTNPSQSTAAERAFAKVWANRVGQQLATMTILLGANAGLQSVLNPDKKVNLLDPSKSDWLKFKFGNLMIDPSSGQIGVLNFIKELTKAAIKPQEELYGKSRIDILGEKAIGYGRGKLAPGYSIPVDLVTRSDFFGNPLPYIGDEPKKGKHTLTAWEYLFQKAPLPVAEAAKVTYQSAIDNGADESQLNDVLKGILSGAISGSTGFRVAEAK